MTSLRSLFVRQRWIASWLIVAALAVRVLVPAGYMPSGTGGLGLMICSGQMSSAMPMPMPMVGMQHHDHGGHDTDHKTDEPCAFAGLAMPSLAAAAQPVAPAPAIVAIAAPIARLADARAPPQRAFLRPPLRGPPSFG